MIKIIIYRDNRKKISSYKITGHSGYDKAGQDIVCAAVSSVSQAATLGLSEIAGIEIECVIKDAYLECHIPCALQPGFRQKADILLETMVLFLKQMKEQYGRYIEMSEHVQLSEQEV